MAAARAIAGARPAVTPALAARALLVVAVLAIAAFDAVGPNLAFNDDWGFAWSVAHFPHIYPAQSALAYPQDAFAWAVTLAGHDHRLLRLTVLPFVVIAAAGVHALARELGADSTWSAIAALSLVACPVFAADATTFMSDVPYVGLEVAFLVLLARHLGGRGAAWPIVLLAVLATLQRQVGLLLPLAWLAALAIRRENSLGEWARAGAGVAAAAAAVGVVTLAGLAPPTQANRLAAASNQSLLFGLLGLMFVGGTVGLGAAALAPGLLRRPITAWPLAAAVIVWEACVFTLAGHNVLPGNVLVPAGLNMTLPPHTKPPVYPAWLWLGLEGLSVAAAAGFALRLARPAPSPAMAMLGTAAAVQFLPVLLVHYIPFDRYFLPVLAAVLPAAAVAASGASAARAWAGIAIAAAMLVFYGAGEQDYQAWQTARDQQARNAYRMASPYEVDAGYEANAVYGEVPAYDSDGTILSGLANPEAPDFSALGPAHPLLKLLVVPASDPRPGVAYESLAPGKVIIVRPAP